MRQLHRILPALAAGLLITFALIGATDPRSNRHAVPASLYYPTCTDQLESSAGDSTIVLSYHDGLVQPLGTTGNIGACSLSVSIPNYAYGASITQVQSWDPVALVGDPTTVALRQVSDFVSDTYGWHGKDSYVPPVIVQSLGNVAEAQRSTIAVEFDSQTSSPYDFQFTGDGSPDLPIAYHWVNHGAAVPLNGNHPVVAHVICGGDQALQNLFNCQSVVRCDSAYGNDKSVVVQRFRVPRHIQLYWVELAFHTVTPANSQTGTIAVLDAQGQSQPPSSIGSALCSASFQHANNVAAWDSHMDFDHSIELQPYHDYWLWVTTINDFSLYVRHRTGNESTTFQNDIGDLFYINGASPPWTKDPGNALDFKIVGLPLDPTSVPPPTRTLGTLRLRCSPNPAHGASMLAWSGARGTLRLEVLDARGRRVASAGVEGAAGQWLFRGASDDGRPLPAGVYFVRAVDGAGRAAVERVVLVR
jgi:hypothetical protein